MLCDADVQFAPKSTTCKKTASCDPTPCSLVDKGKHVGRTYCFCLQGEKNSALLESEIENMGESSCKTDIILLQNDVKYLQDYMRVSNFLKSPKKFVEFL